MSRAIRITSLFAILLCTFGLQLAQAQSGSSRQPKTQPGSNNGAPAQTGTTNQPRTQPGSNNHAPAQPGTITIVKVAQPSSAQNFSFYAFGANSGCCMPVQLSGLNTAPANQKTWTLAPGSYSWKEDFHNPVPVPGWTLASISCSPAGSATVNLSTLSFTANLTAGQNITCTFTDKKPTGTVTVKKVLVPATDPGKFTLQLTPSGGTLLANFLNGGNGAVMGPVTVPAGNYIVSEVGGSNGTSMANYTSVISGAGCGSNGAVTVAAGSNILCTITNTWHPGACTGWPLLANVNITPPGMPFGPQSVDICSGGKVTFHNVNSGASWTIQYFSGPTPFPSVPLPNNTVGTTAPFTTTGAYAYKINGTPAFVVHGHIIVH
jgi:plastocyanin